MKEGRKEDTKGGRKEGVTEGGEGTKSRGRRKVGKRQ